MNSEDSQPRTRVPAVSVVIPVYNAGDVLERIMAPLRKGDVRPLEIIVVDDASTDDTAKTARNLGAEVVTLDDNAGPAAARNCGAERARGDIVLFIDGDVIPRSDTVRRVADWFANDPKLAAVFGSYDDSPEAPGLVSRYRNLLHHYTHQTANTDAHTFWGACGAVRRDLFLQLGGFDTERYRYPSVEDIELGLRLTRPGHRIRLDPELQVKHLKRWTLTSMIHTDVFRRAVPWTRLMLADRELPDDLNTTWPRRIAALGAAAVPAGLVLALAWLPGVWIALAGLMVLLVADAPLFMLFVRRYGLGFALGCVPLQILFYIYSALSFVITALFGREARARG